MMEFIEIKSKRNIRRKRYQKHLQRKKEMTPTLGFSFGGLFFKTKGFAQSDLYLKNTFKNKNLKMFFLKTLIVPAESSLLPVAKTAPRQKLLAELTRDHNTQVKKLQKLSRLAHRPPPIPMASLDPMPSPFGGRPRNSRATSPYPSLTLGSLEDRRTTDNMC